MITPPAIDMRATLPTTPSASGCHVVVPALSGGGAWGTALAIHAAKMGHATLLWAREPEVVASVNGPSRENTMYLKVLWRQRGVRKLPVSEWPETGSGSTATLWSVVG